MYQALSPPSAFCTCAPTKSLFKHLTSVQYAVVWALNFSQCFSQEPQVQVVSEVPLMFFILIFLSVINSSVCYLAGFGLQPSPANLFTVTQPTIKRNRKIIVDRFAVAFILFSIWPH